MTNDLEFHISCDREGALRFDNWNDFVEREERFRFQPNENANAVTFVTFNAGDAVASLLSIFSKESRKDFDVYIVDNASKSEEFDKVLKAAESSGLSIVVLRTRQNLGGAGGYAVAVERVLASSQYQYCVITEDDAFPVDEDMLTELLNLSEPLTVIKSRFMDSGGWSGSLHFTSYPIKLLERTGVLDPSYFMRADDEYFGGRIGHAMRRYGYELFLCDKRYTHPMIKRGAGKLWQTYFSIRNSLATKAAMHIDSHTATFMAYYAISLFLYVHHAFFKIIRDRDVFTFSAIFRGIWDFLFRKRTFSSNQKSFSQYLSLQSSVPDVPGLKRDFVTFEDVAKLCSDRFMADPYLAFQKSFVITSNRKPGAILKGAVFSSFNSPIQCVARILSSSVAIEEFDVPLRKAHVAFLTPSPIDRLLSFVSAIVALPIAAVAYSILTLPILVKHFLLRFCPCYGRIRR